MESREYGSAGPASSTYTPREIYGWIQGQIAGKQTWLETHGGKVQWSEQDREAKRRDLSILQFMASKYEEKFRKETA